MRARSVGGFILRGVFAILSLAPAAFSASLYSITDLGALPSGNARTAYGINESGDIAGEAGSPGSVRPFLYFDGLLSEIPDPATYSSARAINDSGDVVGFSSISGGYRPFLYSDGVVTTLSSLGGPFAMAYGINNAGLVVGESNRSTSGPMKAFVYSIATGKMENLGTLRADDTGASVANAINNAGQIVGEAATDDGENHAFLYSEGTMLDLGTVGGDTSVAYGINSLGDVVGYSTLAGIGGEHAFIYSNGVMLDIGVRAGANARARAINDLGQVVGDSAGAFLYENGQMFDLNALIPADSGWQLSYAYGINNSGQIVGAGYREDIGFSAFLLTPVPEPSALALLFVSGGILGVSIRAGRRQFRSPQS